MGLWKIILQIRNSLFFELSASVLPEQTYWLWLSFCQITDTAAEHVRKVPLPVDLEVGRQPCTASGLDITAKANQNAGMGVQWRVENGCLGAAVHHTGWTSKHAFSVFPFWIHSGSALFPFPVTETLPWVICSSLTHRLGWSDWGIAVMSEGRNAFYPYLRQEAIEITKGQVAYARTYKKRSDRSVSWIYPAWFSVWTTGERRMLFCKC